MSDEITPVPSNKATERYCKDCSTDEIEAFAAKCLKVRSTRWVLYRIVAWIIFVAFLILTFAQGRFTFDDVVLAFFVIGLGLGFSAIVLRHGDLSVNKQLRDMILSKQVMKKPAVFNIHLICSIALLVGTLFGMSGLAQVRAAEEAHRQAMYQQKAAARKAATQKASNETAQPAATPTQKTRAVSVANLATCPMRELIRIANTGNTEAQVELGRRYTYGINDTPINYPEARKCFLAAAEQNNPQAIFELAMFHFGGRGIPKSEDEAMRLLQKSADAGFSGAQYQLGIRAEATDKEKALYWYKKAAAQGNPGATEKLKELEKKQQAEQAQPTPEQIAAARKEEARNEIETLTQKATQGDVDAQVKLGIIRFEGKDSRGQTVQKNKKEAAKLFREAAAKGNLEAKFRLAICYLSGQGVSKSYDEGMKLLHEAAEAGNSGAQYQLGFRYNQKKNLENALYWYTKAAEQGNPGGKFALEKLTQENTATPRREEAFKKIQKAVEDRRTPKTTQTSIFNPQLQTVETLRQAAANGNVDAQVKLGTLYYDGKEVEKNDAEAAKLFRAAADSGNLTAKFKLAICYFTGRGVPKSHDEGMKLLHEAAEAGDSGAQYQLGFRYEQIDREKAIYWYKKAAAQGNPGAKAYLRAHP